MLLAPFGDLVQTPTEPPTHRPHMNRELPLPAAGYDMRESEEVERAGFSSLPLYLPERTSAELQQPRLLRVERQPKLCEPLGQNVHDFFGVLPILKAEDGIISEADFVRFTPQSGLHLMLEPFVQHLVKIKVGQERADRLPLSSTRFAHEKLSVVNETDLYPLAYQSEDACVADPFLDHLHELLSHDRVKGPHDTLPTTRTSQSMSPSLAHNIRWKVKNWLSLGNGVSGTNYI